MKYIFDPRHFRDGHVDTGPVSAVLDEIPNYFSVERTKTPNIDTRLCSALQDDDVCLLLISYAIFIPAHIEQYPTNQLIAQ